MTTVRTRRKPTHIRDLLDEDADVIAIDGFQPWMNRLVRRGDRFRLSDGIVRQYPTYFAVVIPVNQVLGEIER